MAVWTSPATPIGGTAITTAFWNVNGRDNLNYLRGLLPDAPAADYALISTGVSAATFQKIGNAQLAAGVAVANLGYTPVNKAGDAMSGGISFPQGSGITFGQTGTPGQIADSAAFSFWGARGDIARIYNAALSQIMLAISPTVVAVLGQLQAASASIVGALSAGSFSAPSATIDALSSANIAATGTLSAPVLTSTQPTGVAPLTVASTTEVANLNASRVAGKVPTATPAAGASPLADGSGKLDAWVTSSAGVPSGLIAAFEAAAAIAVGWARYTAADGRMLVGAGTTFTVTYLEANNYGASWSHTHTTPAHAHSGAPLSVSGTTGTPSGTNTTGGTGNTSADGSHTHSFSASVAGTTATDGSGTSGSSAWVIPSRAIVWAQKS